MRINLQHRLPKTCIFIIACVILQFQINLERRKLSCLFNLNDEKNEIFLWNNNFENVIPNIILL